MSLRLRGDFEVSREGDSVGEEKRTRTIIQVKNAWAVGWKLESQ